MWRKILLPLLILLPVSIGLDNNTIKMSLDYFIYKDVRFVCLLTCERGKEWILKFAKQASLHKIAVASTTNDLENSEKCLRYMACSVGVLMDAGCPFFYDIMTKASQNMMFDSNHKWFIVDAKSEVFGNNYDPEVLFYENSVSNYSSEVLKFLETLNTSVDADIVTALKEGLATYNFYEVFSFGKVQGGDLIVNNVGYWDTENGLVLNIDLNSYKYYRRWDFQQLNMRMVVVTKIPLKEFKPELIIGRRPLLGARITQTTATMFHVVADTHNFRYKYSNAEKWIGDLNPEQCNKSALASLHYREQDITPVLRMDPKYVKTIDCPGPSLTTILVKYYYRIPTHGPGKYENQFLRPLTTWAWFCVTALLFLCATALLLSAKLEQRPMPWQFAIFSVAASFCQQSFEDSSEGAAVRMSNARKITVLVTGLSCVLIYNYYTSSVVSWLLNGPPPSINSLQELLDSPLEQIYEDIGYTRSWLQLESYYFNKRNTKVEDAMRKKVLNKKKDDPLFVPVEDGIDMVRAGGYAYHTDSDSANTLISRKFNQKELCELGSLVSMEKTSLYSALQKDSPYKEFFVWSLTQLKERGIASCIQRRTVPESVFCEGSSPRALALGGAAPAFLLLLFGYFAATVVMLLERFINRRFDVKTRFRNKTKAGYGSNKE